MRSTIFSRTYLIHVNDIRIMLRMHKEQFNPAEELYPHNRGIGEI